MSETPETAGTPEPEDPRDMVRRVLEEANRTSVRAFVYGRDAAARRTTRPVREPLAGLRVPSTTVASDG